jgi:hypothetical protein
MVTSATITAVTTTIVPIFRVRSLLTCLER